MLFGEGVRGQAPGKRMCGYTVFDKFSKCGNMLGEGGDVNTTVDRLLNSRKRGRDTASEKLPRRRTRIYKRESLSDGSACGAGLQSEEETIVSSSFF